MKIKPEERPTVIGLGVATGVVLLFGVGRTLPRLLNGNKPEAAAATNAPGAAITPATQGTLGAGFVPGNMPMKGMGGSKLDMYDDSVSEPITTKNPFTPAVPEEDGPNPIFHPTAPPRKVTSTPRPFTSVAVGPSVLPTFRAGNPRLGAGGSVPAGLTPQNDPNAQANQMILAGVIAGPQAVAVIHVGERSYPLSAGEQMPFNMSLTRITEDGVYVKRGKQTWFIQVGKSLSVAMPVKPGTEGFNAPDSMAPGMGFGPVRRVAAAEDSKPTNTVELTSTPVPSGNAEPSAKAQP